MLQVNEVATKKKKREAKNNNTQYSVALGNFSCYKTFCNAAMPSGRQTQLNAGGLNSTSAI